MNSLLSEGYLHWLGSQIREEGNQVSVLYWDLVSIMYEKEFVYSNATPHDRNRLVDGMDLRVEYARLTGKNADDLRALGPVSFLEVLIGLSRRLSFQAGGSPEGWAWQLLINLKLTKMMDPLSKPDLQQIDDILNTVILRTYNPDGTGGFFPLAFAEEDQTRIELWYQMSAFVDELHPEH